MCHTGSCVGYLGEVVEDGEPFQPGPDPCVSCVCRKGTGDRCRSIACSPPPPRPGVECRLVPGTCCEFVCEDVKSMEANMERGL